jgi:hypothetical protein
MPLPNNSRPIGFNENQLKIIRKLQWIIYPLAIVFIAVEVLPQFVPSLKEKLAVVKTVFGFIEKGIFVLLFLIFSWALLGFILHEIGKNRQKVGYDNVLLELKNKGKIIPFIVVLVVLGISIFMNYLLFEPSSILQEEDLLQISFIEKAIFAFFYIVVHFLLIVFTIRAIRNPAYFILTKEGFFYEPADVSVGFILWKDIAAIKEDRLLVNRGGFAGPSTNTTLVISFKEPEKYNRKYNFILRKFVELATKLIKYQTGGVGDIVIDPVDFGDKYPEVKELMFKHFEMNK